MTSKSSRPVYVRQYGATLAARLAEPRPPAAATLDIGIFAIRKASILAR
jgi:hypothetical protein